MKFHDLITALTVRPIIFLMKFLKDKLLIFIILTALLQLYVMVTRGDWETNIDQKGASADNKNLFKLTDDLSIESEHTISKESRIIGTHTYFLTDSCFTIDSLVIIPYDKDVRTTVVYVAVRQIVKDTHLRHVRILEFVVHDVLILFLEIES